MAQSDNHLLPSFHRGGGIEYPSADGARSIVLYPDGRTSERVDSGRHLRPVSLEEAASTIIEATTQALYELQRRQERLEQVVREEGQ